MRVHRLEIEAFGPFAERVVVDVDALSAEGLFLIHGPTGSGKTSLLDAICFALYADVPGARSRRGLRSDHAKPNAVPRVALELTAGERRFRIVRSPEFHRPKRRGTGLSKVQPSVTLEERTGGRWQVRSTRHDEVADVVQDVLGMGMGQFAKVVLLPQGEFAAFLRATPEDRREVLERLFDITAFADVEAWLAEERRAAGAGLDLARGALTHVLARVEDVLADAGPGPAVGVHPGWEGSSSLGELPAESAPGLLREVAEVLSARMTSTMAEFDAAAGLEHAAGDALARARTVDEHRRRGTRALERLAALAEQSAGHEVQVRILAEAQRAAALSGHLAAHARTVVAESANAGQVVESLRALTRAGLPGTVLAEVSDSGSDVVSRVADQVRALDDTVAAVARELDDARDRTRRRDELAARATEVTERTDVLAARLAHGEAEQRRLGEDVEGLAASGARVAELELRLATAKERLGLLDLAEDDEAGATSLRPRRDQLRDAALDRRSELLDLRQRRLDGIAGELASRLTDGDPCPVCGAREHPLAASVTDAVAAADITAAEARHDDAERELRAADAELQQLTTRADTRRRSLGTASRADLEAAEHDAAVLVDGARAAASAHTLAVAELTTVTRAIDRHRQELTAVLATAESLTVLLTELAAQETAAGRRLARLRTRHARCPCASDDPAEHARVGEALTRHRGLVAELAAATARTTEAEAALRQAAMAAGFEDSASASDALRHAADCDRMRNEVAAHLEELAASRAVVEEIDVVEALAADPPDIAALERRAREAREALMTAAAAQDEAARALRGLERLLPSVDDACRAVATAAVRDARVRDLADTTSGIGPDNTLRMRLTAYVLASRLEKVATLANERLGVMGGGRYVLEHSDERAARGARSGLDLRVLDQWTGRARDTASLSGGESFMASLALALGLADAVREEAGGFDLGTLFIDEGFGSLDDDSLEQVLTVLDGLREGGRAVGVVSHVADLRARVTHQAVVHKGAAGSTVEVRIGGAAAGTAA